MLKCSDMASREYIPSYSMIFRNASTIQSVSHSRKKVKNNDQLAKRSDSHWSSGGRKEDNAYLVTRDSCQDIRIKFRR